MYLRSFTVLSVATRTGIRSTVANRQLNVLTRKPGKPGPCSPFRSPAFPMSQWPPTSSTAPTLKVSPRGATRLKDGHVWVYRSDIVSAEGVAPGALVQVTDHRSKPMGTALYSSSSQIAIRMLSDDPVKDFPALLRQRTRRRPRLPRARSPQHQRLPRNLQRSRFPLVGMMYLTSITGV